ncbi:molybdopterin-dependent oxidoreductase [Bosea vaviloviae]|nr:molybdopterin-dependent oxidoreductase [Bosea vaviloviae]
MSTPIAPHNPRPNMGPSGIYRRLPLEPHQMDERLTATSDLFVLIHMGTPAVDVSMWSLGIGGMVSRPLSIPLTELRSLPRVTVQTVHQCAGNPLQPTVPTRRVACVEWAGVALKSLIDLAELDPRATHMWSFGMDHGEFEGTSCDGYGKDLTIDRLLEAGALVAYELNGSALPTEHGFPARLVVPGYYGTNTVKWLDRIEFRDKPLDALFTTIYYNDAKSPAEARKPVWEIPVGSLFTSPAPGSSHRRGDGLDVAGWAWAKSGVSRVDVSVDGGANWRPAKLEPDRGAAWRRFEETIGVPEPGPLGLVVRATANDGRSQPLEGVRYAAHAITINVV